MTDATATPAASDAAPAAAPAATATPAAAPAADATPAPSAEAPKDNGNQPAPDAADDANKDSGKDEPAQGSDQPDADKADKANQPSDDQESTDTDKKDADGEEKGEGNQDAQPAYSDFAMPEGMELDSEALNEATPILRELNATQEQAQKMVDVAASMLSKAAKKMADQHNAVVDGWRKETLEIFGKDGETQFMQNVGRAEEVVKHFFNDDQRKVLTHYGLGNHPAFFAMCMAIAEGTGEDRLTSLGGAGAKGEKTLANTWYPET